MTLPEARPGSVTGTNLRRKETNLVKSRLKYNPWFINSTNPSAQCYTDKRDFMWLSIRKVNLSRFFFTSNVYPSAYLCTHSCALALCDGNKHDKRLPNSLRKFTDYVHMLKPSSFKPRDAYRHQRTGGRIQVSTPAQPKPIPEPIPMRTYCPLDPQEQIPAKFQNFKIQCFFHARKWIWKCRLQNGGHFVSIILW